MEKIIEALAKKAQDAKTSHEAMQLSQAAVNVANALNVIHHLPKR